MHVVGARAFGGAEVLELFERRALEPDEGEVRIRVAAAAVNPIDLLMRSGALADAMAPFGPLHVLGFDVAGVIDRLGPGVTRLSIGQTVMAVVSPFRVGGGAYQERLVVPEASVVAAPVGATAAQAWTLPMNGLTAQSALRTLELPPGATLLVTGGAGWLASLVFGLAKARGIKTIADAAPEDRAGILAAGCDLVLERGPALVEQARDLFPNGVDASLDTAALGPSVAAAIRDGGVRAIVREEADDLADPRVRTQPIGMMHMLSDTRALQELSDLASSGALRMQVFRTFPAAQASKAHARHAQGGVRGRIVILF